MADTPKRPQTRVEPSVPVTDWGFTYQRGADVQATWRRFGWTPPSEKRSQFFEEPVRQPAPVYAFRGR